VLVLLAGCPTPGQPERPRQWRRPHQGFRSSSSRSGQRTSSPASSSRTAAIRRSRRRLRSSPPSNARSAARTLGSANARRALARCARSIFVGRSLASLRRVRAAPPSGRSLRAAVVPPYDRASARQPRPGSQETGPADRAWCAGLRGLLAARVHGSAHPRPLIGTDPGSGKVECRRLGGSAADQPYGVVHAQADAAAAGSDPPAGRPAPGAGGVPSSALVSILA
jgi:hypothetical protein